MFSQLRVRNFRTHVDTALELGPITLLIGPNNAGKTNFLAAVAHFARLVSKSRPGQAKPYILRHGDFFPHRHRLASEDQPIAFKCLWKHQLGEVEYEVQLLHDERKAEHVGCRERIEIRTSASSEKAEASSGWECPKDRLDLERILVEGNGGLDGDHRQLASFFFRDLGGCHFFHFQPGFLNGGAKAKSAATGLHRLRIASDLGCRGENLQSVLKRVIEEEQRTYDAFVTSLRRFEPSFHGLRYDQGRDRLLWLFDLGHRPPRAAEFPAEVVSDGLLRAAAIALLSSMKRAPALIMIEEIENGISQRNLGRFWGWLQQAAGPPDSSERGYNTQFLLTSHSPSILLEISKHLDDVYYMRLVRSGYKTVATNLNTALLGFASLGTIEGQVEKREGKDVIILSPQQLMSLWYSGVIGGEPVGRSTQ